MKRFRVTLVLEADNGEDSTIDNYLDGTKKTWYFTVNETGKDLVDAVNNAVKRLSDRVSIIDAAL